MTTNVMDRRNRRVTSDSRWSISIDDHLYFVDDTSFDKISERATAVMICAGNAFLIEVWRAWFQNPTRTYLVPPTDVQLADGTIDSITLTIIKKPDFTVDFTRGLYDDFKECARFCGTGAPFAKDCYSANGCSTTCIESAKSADPRTGGEIKFFDFDSSLHNLSSPASSFQEMTDQLVDRGMIMNKTGNVVPMNPLNQEALKKAIGAGTVAISAPTGQVPRLWTDREKEDVSNAMRRIVEREEAATG